MFKVPFHRRNDSLDKDTVKTAVNVLVTPHLDYGNGLLFNTSKKLVGQL